MKSLKQIIFVFAMVVGLAFTASAQKDDQKGRPPKNPPTVDPKPKPPRDTPPKGERPGRPGMAYHLVLKKGDEYFG